MRMSSDADRQLIGAHEQVARHGVDHHAMHRCRPKRVVVVYVEVGARWLVPRPDSACMPLNVHHTH
ncbi:hypothetical protein ADT26_09960 [Xanthomonas oryzae]|nr:hypothetical protein AXO1947_10240 [Xanthomonas oryzae pv. oryzae]KOR44237.1 hypothetical protein ADT26_09960 [Xanthomonas oryzae]AUI90621.1 hypothetical protein BVV16_11230 [Xanthomonas oryzae pv. oryzae]AUI94298.1 hypothetical protein BVV17_11245 [Xanthomonas oryzae pv. oryzae]AUI97967.1 hypothetical protein BVV18_11245 [Xanthomonas oryzae pv. oryzae]